MSKSYMLQLIKNLESLRTIFADLQPFIDKEITLLKDKIEAMEKKE